MMEKDKKNWVERTITIVSIALVGAVFGILIYQLIINEQSSPDIIVKLGELETRTNHFAIAVQAKNEGTQTAKDVFLEVFADHTPESKKGKIHFDYIPGKSSVKGWVTFMEKPDYSNLKVHIMGYEVP